MSWFFFFTSEALNDRNKHFTLCCFCISIFVSEHLSVNPSVCVSVSSICLPSHLRYPYKESFFQSSVKGPVGSLRSIQHHRQLLLSLRRGISVGWIMLTSPSIVVQKISGWIFFSSPSALVSFFLNSGIVAICLTKFVNRERKNILKSTQKWGARRVQTHLYFCFLF